MAAACQLCSRLFNVTAVIPHSRSSSDRHKGQVIARAGNCDSKIYNSFCFLAEVMALGFDIARCLSSKKNWRWMGLIFYLMNNTVVE